MSGPMRALMGLVIPTRPPLGPLLTLVCQPRSLFQPSWSWQTGLEWCCRSACSQLAPTVDLVSSCAWWWDCPWDASLCHYAHDSSVIELLSQLLLVLSLMVVAELQPPRVSFCPKWGQGHFWWLGTCAFWRDYCKAAHWVWLSYWEKVFSYSWVVRSDVFNGVSPKHWQCCNSQCCRVRVTYLFVLLSLSVTWRCDLGSVLWKWTC